jgi:hypothetical protein
MTEPSVNQPAPTSDTPQRRRWPGFLRSLSFTRGDWIALAVITLVVAAFFSPLWLRGGWVPYGGGDLVSFMWPNYRFASRMLRSGRLPLWNPHVYSGMPFWADNQTAALYPPNLLIMLLTDVSYQVLEGLVVFHIWLAGVAMYACLRLLGADERFAPAPSALAAVAWMLSDMFVMHQGHLNMIASAVWLPTVFLGTWRALRDVDWRWAALGAVAFALSALAGNGQITYMIALLVSAAGLWWIVARLRESPRAALTAVGMTALVGILGMGLSAAGWLPTVEMIGYTERGGFGYELASQFSLPPRALIGLIAPSVPGRSVLTFYAGWDRVEMGYMGALTLALAVAGLVIGIGKRRSGLAVFLAITSVLALLMAFGQYFPLHRIAYRVVPGVAQFRVPARYVLLFDFGAVILAAFALQVIPWRAVGWAAVAVLAVEMLANGIGVEVQYDDPLTGYRHEDALAWLAETPGAPASPYRIESATRLWQPSLGALYGTLYDIHGSFNPLSLAHYEAFYWSVGARGTPLYDYLGVKYVIAESQPGDESFVPVYTADSGVTIYLNLGALPLVHLVYEAVPVASVEDGWNLVHRNEWDPGAVVYVENGPALDGTRPPSARVSFAAYEPNKLVYDVYTPSPAYLVTSEVLYPGWRATVDGERVPIYRVNLAFRGVYIEEPGQHTVRLVFCPPTVILGLAISAASMVGLVVAFVWGRSRRKLPATDGGDARA